jgi:Protein of unknown function (DUF3106)
MALGISAMIAAPCSAQREKPPARQPQKQEHRQQQQDVRRAQPDRRQNQNANRPPAGNPNRPDSNARPNNNPNRPPSAYTPPPARKFSELNPQEQKRIVDSYNKQRNLTPAQKEELHTRGTVFGKLTPEQQNHLKNDVFPKWKQMPKTRQDAISHRLAVLQNMPESARNRHLNDPNFTRGMSEEDKFMLHDLSHMHVGGAPEPPSE